MFHGEWLLKLRAITLCHDSVQLDCAVIQLNCWGNFSHEELQCFFFVRWEWGGVVLTRASLNHDSSPFWSTSILPAWLYWRKHELYQLYRYTSYLGRAHLPQSRGTTRMITSALAYAYESSLSTVGSWNQLNEQWSNSTVSAKPLIFIGLGPWHLLTTWRFNLLGFHGPMFLCLWFCPTFWDKNKVMINFQVEKHLQNPLTWRICSIPKALIKGTL